jgi:hypothetical protein
MKLDFLLPASALVPVQARALLAVQELAGVLELVRVRLVVLALLQELVLMLAQVPVSVLKLELGLATARLPE